MLKDKIKSLASLKKIVAALKSKRRKIVFTNGCFDLVHYGHIQYLEDAKQRGDILIVGVNSDASVKSIKGDKRPLCPESDRLRVIAALESVDYVVSFNEATPLRVIKELKPDVLVKGADWKKSAIVGSDFVKHFGGKVSAIRLVKGRSTTNLIKKIAETF